MARSCSSIEGKFTMLDMFVALGGMMAAIVALYLLIRKGERDYALPSWVRQAGAVVIAALVILISVTEMAPYSLAVIAFLLLIVLAAWASAVAVMDGDGEKVFDTSSLEKKAADAIGAEVMTEDEKRAAAEAKNTGCFRAAFKNEDGKLTRGEMIVFGWIIAATAIAVMAIVCSVVVKFC